MKRIVFAVILAGILIIAGCSKDMERNRDEEAGKNGLSFDELSVSYSPEEKKLEVFASFPEGRMDGGTLFVFVEDEKTGEIVERFKDELAKEDIKTAAKCTQDFCGTRDSVSRSYAAQLDPSGGYAARVALLGKESGAFMGKEKVFIEP